MHVWIYKIFIKSYLITFFMKNGEMQVEGGIALIEMLGVSWLFNKWIHHDSAVSRETLKVIP